MNARHRFTRAGLKRDRDEWRSQARAEKTRADRLADELALRQHDCQRLQAALKAWEARWANAHPVSVPAPRDLRPSDERPTVPTDVSRVRAIFPVTPIYPISERSAAPDAANPANIPAA